ncbi:MAG: ferritin family protein [Carboxydocellales bacterium]
MHPYRCEICGETFLGANPPDRCPFCGSAMKLIVPAAEWRNFGKIAMCEQSLEDCQKALMLEINNAAYYKCAAAKAQNQITEAIYTRLMKHEMEHAEVLATVMGKEAPELPNRSCYDEDAKNMIVSSKHESTAISFYTQVMNRAPEPRLQQIFRALAEVETQHLILANIYIFR